MADAYYNDFPNALLGNGVQGAIDLDTDDIRMFLYDEGADALNLADTVVSDVIAGARIASSTNLASKTVGTVADGVFDHADFVFTSVSGASVESLNYWKYNGTETLAPLMFNLDSWTGLPVTPNGGDITAAPHVNGVLNIS